MKMEQQAAALTEAFWEAYSGKRNMDLLLSYLTEDVTWIGPDSNLLCCGKTETAAYLMGEGHGREEGERPAAGSRFHTKKLSDSVCLVWGEWENEASSPFGGWKAKSRWTALCLKEETGFKLSHIHLTCPEEGRILSKITQNVPGGIHICLNDPGFTLLSVSPSFVSMFGYTEEEIRDIFHSQFLSMVDPRDRDRLKAVSQCHDESGTPIETEYRVRKKDGEIIWVLDKAVCSMTPGGETFYCLLVDITKRKRQEEELRLSLERHKIIMDQTEDIIFEWDVRRDTMVFSTNWEKKFGYRPVRERLSRRIENSPNIYPDDRDTLGKTLERIEAGIPYVEAEIRLRNRDDRYIWCRVRATVQFSSEHAPIKAIGVIADIDGEKRQRQLLLEQIQKDALTGLYNKKTTHTRVENALQNSMEACLMIIDIDNFKSINDTFGHLCGDRVLSEAAGQLKRVFDGDAVLGRIGGDEFLALLTDDAAGGSIPEKMDGVRKALEAIPIGEQSGAGISCSIGIAVYPRDGRDFNSLFENADVALYHVKNHGKHNFAFYRPDLKDPILPDIKEARTAVNEIIDSSTEGSIDDELIRYTFQMLYESVDIKTAVNGILEIVGRAYDVSRVYIFENVRDDLACSNTFEWCNEGITPELPNLQNLSYHEDLEDYQNNFNEAGIFYCSDIRTLSPALNAILAPQNISSLLQCAIRDEGKFKGYVGFDECRSNRYWTKEQVRTLTFIANILSTFLLKLRLKEELERRLSGPDKGV